MYMSNAISDPEILPDVGVAIEYKVPNTSFRIDFTFGRAKRAQARLDGYRRAEAMDKDR
jgi:hypothetical protein